MSVSKRGFLVLLFFSLVLFLAVSNLSASAAEGDEAWNTTLNFSANGRYAYDIVVDSSGNSYVAGFFQNDVTFNNDWKVAKVSSAGAPVWNKTFIFSGSSSRIAYGIDLDSSASNVFVAGVSTQTNDDWRIQKLSTSDGSNQNNVSFDWFGYSDKAEDIYLDSSNNVYVVGNAYFDLNDNAWAIMKLDSSLNQAWNMTYNLSYGVSQNAYDVVSAGTSMYIAGYNGNDAYLLKLSTTDGSHQKNVTINWTSGSDYAYTVTMDSSGNIFIGGTDGTPEGHVAKYDSDLVEQWNSSFNTLSNIYDIVVDSSGNIYVTGEFAGGGGFSDTDWRVLKLNSTGSQNASWSFDWGDGSDVPWGIDVKGTDNIYITGTFCDDYIAFMFYCADESWKILSLSGSSGNGGNGGGDAIPEFSDYAIALILITVISGFFVMRSRENR